MLLCGLFSSCLVWIPYLGGRAVRGLKALLFSFQKPFPRDGVVTLGRTCLKHCFSPALAQGQRLRGLEGTVEKGLKNEERTRVLKGQLQSGRMCQDVEALSLPRHGLHGLEGSLASNEAIVFRS